MRAVRATPRREIAPAPGDAPQAADPVRAPGARLDGRAIVAGSAVGEVVHADQPLSFWGGYDAGSGRITDTHHPLAGRVAAGKALVLPRTRGSSTTTAVLLEAIRRETAPRALITRGVDAFLALACVVGQELYGRSPVLVAVGEAEFRELAGWEFVEVRDGALIRGDRC